MQNDLFRHQRHLYRSLLNELSLLERGKSREISRYEASYKRLLSRPAAPSDWTSLAKSIQRSRIVLIGDFHTLRQSQKAALKILERIEAPVALALECVHQKHQASLDSFIAGNLSLENLRSVLDFDFFWPFPWANYEELFSICLSKKIPILALNVDNRPDTPNNLQRRDRAAAEAISQFLESHPKFKVAVLYGDLHLARTGIPRHLKTLKCGPATVIYQNEPRLYWAHRDKIDTGQTEVFRLGSWEFVLMNSVPWVKLQSHLDWLEGGDSEVDEPGADLLARNFNDLSNLLGIPAPEFPSVDLFLSSDGHSLKRLLRDGDLSRSDRRLLMHSMLFRRPAVISRVVWLPGPGMNFASEAAAQLLHETLLGFPPAQGKPMLYSLIYRQMISYFGAKLLNPKRKCSELSDIESVLTSPFRKSEPKLKRHAFHLARKWLRWLFGQTKHRPRLRGNESVALMLEASRLIGFVLGDRLFLASKNDNSLGPKMTALFRLRPIDEKNAASALKRLANRHLKHVPHVKAKTEKL